MIELAFTSVIIPAIALLITKTIEYYYATKMHRLSYQRNVTGMVVKAAELKYKTGPEKYTYVNEAISQIEPDAELRNVLIESAVFNIKRRYRNGGNQKDAKGEEHD